MRLCRPLAALSLTVGNMKSADNKEQNYQFKTKFNMKTKTSILALTKAFFILLVSGWLFSSCDDNGAADTLKCYEQVQKKYPKSTIFPLPKDKYKYVVVDSIGNIMYVETMDGKSPNVTSEVFIKTCR